MEHGEEILRYDRISGMEEAGTSQNAFPPFGRRMIHESLFAGRKFTAHLGLDLQKFTPRSSKSLWSKINKEKALVLINAGKMQPSGLKEIERAKNDGRWGAAYDSASQSNVPSDFQLALDGNAQAKNFFETLDRRNRYAVLFRIQTAKTAETRERKILQFVQMLERHEKIHE